jgi:non-canonical purine NTP pyrophosphatase (RdgB/HAM1 family)
MKTIGNVGLYDIAKKLGNYKATAKTIIGYAKNVDEIYYFEGILEGKIVPPKGDFGFGWDPIFKPGKHSQSLAELTQEEKNQISMRRDAANKLKDFLETKK